jgi:protein involved in polysaccharide export with SLBB domain
VCTVAKEEPSIRVAVVGAVAAPGIYEVKGVKSLNDILALAQGLNFTATARIQILRGTETILPDDQTVAAQEAAFSTHLQDGDVLYITGKRKG